MEYWLWVVTTLIAGGLTFLSIGKMLVDPWGSDLSDFFSLLVAFILDVFVGINAFKLDYYTNTGSVVSITNMWFLGPAFWAAGILCMGLAMVAVLSSLKDLRLKRGY